jgi:hypothetical protein
MAGNGGLIMDLDAFFEEANTNPGRKQALDDFFRTIPVPRFSADATVYATQLKGIIQNGNIKDFRRFVETFHISPNAMITFKYVNQISDTYRTLRLPLFFAVAGAIGTFNRAFADYLFSKHPDLSIRVPFPDMEYLNTDANDYLPEQMTALMLAAVNGSPDGVQYLLEKGMHPGDRSHKKTALDFLFDVIDTGIMQTIDRLQVRRNSPGISRGERNHIDVLIEDLEDVHRRLYEPIAEILDNVTPDLRIIPTAGIQNVKSKLRSSLPTALQYLSVKGIETGNGRTLRLPRNVVREMVGPKRLPGIHVAPTNTGVSRVNTTLFENAPEPYVNTTNNINVPTNLRRIQTNNANTRRTRRNRRKVSRRRR